MNRQVAWTNVDRVLEQGLDAKAFPGATLAVFVQGELVHERAYGKLTYAEDALPATPDTRYDLASVTKVFVAMAVLKLLGDRDLSLDEKMADRLPELGGSAHADLTVRQLLTHTSGQPRRFTRIVEGIATRALNQNPAGVTSDEIRSERYEGLLADLHDVDLMDPPSTAVAYTSIGFILLGLWVERVSGLRLDHYITQELTGPLKLDSLGYSPDEEALHADRLRGIAPTEHCTWRDLMVWGRVHDEIAAYVGGVVGHAGLFAAVRDVAAFGQAMLEGGRGVLDPAILAASANCQTDRVPGDRRGWGWQLWTRGSWMGDLVSHRSFGHTGFTGTSLLIDADHDLVVSLLTNRVHPSRRNRRINDIRPRVHDEILRQISR